MSNINQEELQSYISSQRSHIRSKHEQNTQNLNAHRSDLEILFNQKTYEDDEELLDLISEKEKLLDQIENEHKDVHNSSMSLIEFIRNERKKMIACGEEWNDVMNEQTQSLREYLKGEKRELKRRLAERNEEMNQQTRELREFIGREKEKMVHLFKKGYEKV
eukprot:TRINITY_DN3037_c0_g1_i2.p2 TRINITY_DN3037_c0_g1~~TRINITY_DN3037_c0_g1_i2.p2  ORF type:complete len:162 (+),score=40.85 TRINITY_DN3037_c0_g1_i2:844-1329(+)